MIPRNKRVMAARVASLLFLSFLLFSFPAFASEVVVKQDEKGHWRLLVNGEPYFVKGVDYRPSRIGESPDAGTAKDWAWYDDNKNGRCDPCYEAWVDENRNEIRDSGEKSVGDFELMRRMGANTIRWYMNDFKEQKPNKKMLRDLFETYGIRSAVGNKFGSYTIDSGADWKSGTDYRNPTQRQRMLASVRRMVLEHKDEPYTLMWLLGNENNLRFTNTNAAQYPEAYATLLDEAARLIHELDGKHPVALVNGDTKLIRAYAEHAPNIDIFGLNAYRGPHGFGSVWREAKSAYDWPVLLTEFGGSQAPGSDEVRQAQYHEGCWKDIVRNAAGGPGLGNSIGGFAFEWLDEWWKAGSPSEQAIHGSIGKVGVDTPKWTQEYCGLVSQGDGQNSPFKRQLRKVVSTYAELWN